MEPVKIRQDGRKVGKLEKIKRSEGERKEFMRAMIIRQSNLQSLDIILPLLMDTLKVPKVNCYCEWATIGGFSLNFPKVGLLNKKTPVSPIQRFGGLTNHLASMKPL